MTKPTQAAIDAALEWRRKNDHLLLNGGFHYIADQAYTAGYTHGQEDLLKELFKLDPETACWLERQMKEGK